MNVHNWKLHAKYTELVQKEARAEVDLPDDASLVLISFGSCSRIAQTALKRARENGLRVGLVRPITLYPFPQEEVREAIKKSRSCPGGGDEYRPDAV